jgi:hypothetical protein
MACPAIIFDKITPSRLIAQLVSSQEDSIAKITGIGRKSTSKIGLSTEGLRDPRIIRPELISSG